MPELPDLTVYLESLEARIANQKLLRARLLNPFLLRTAVPPISALEGKRVVGLRRVGKRIVLEFEEQLFLCCISWWPAGCAGSKARRSRPGGSRSPYSISNRAR